MGKVSDRTALTGASAAVGDLFPIVDVSATTAGSKKMTTVELLNLICSSTINSTAMTGSGAHASQDFLLYSDNGVAKSIAVGELAAAVIALATSLTGSGVVPGTDTVWVSDAGVSKKMTFTEFQTALALAGYTLADIPEYADQAAAQAGLSGTGKLFRFATTGALGVTIA